MAINYTTDIVDNLFASNVATETAYQSPGDFHLPSSFASPSDGQERLLTFIEIVRSYLDVVESTHEAKLLGIIFTRIMAKIRAGATLDAGTGTLAQRDTLEYLAARLKSSVVPEGYFLETLDGNILTTEDGKIIVLEYP